MYHISAGSHLHECTSLTPTTLTIVQSSEQLKLLVLHQRVLEEREEANWLVLFEGFHHSLLLQLEGNIPGEQMREKIKWCEKGE